MIETLDILLSALVLIGAIFILLGSVALVKLPDFFMRLHGPTNASTLGTGGNTDPFCVLLFRPCGRHQPS